MDTYRIREGDSPNLSAVDHRDISAFPTLSKKDAPPVLEEMRRELAELQQVFWANGNHAILVVFQAMDTGGKDGTIRQVFSGMNPQGIDVTGFGVPSVEEMKHDYLWRIHQHTPAKGRIAVFNRSHYEDVLVVRVNNLVPEERWSKRYEQIRNFEQLLVDEGTTIVKVMLHISRDEQKARLEERLADPAKNYKFNPQDLDVRRQWDEYMAAFEKAIAETSTEHAPWFVVPSDRKWYRNLVVAQILIDTLKGLNLTYPVNRYDLSNVVIE